MNEIISTWQGIASYLGVNVDYLKRLSREHKDFPVFKFGRIWTTKQSLVEWFEKKANHKK